MIRKFIASTAIATGTLALIVAPAAIAQDDAQSDSDVSLEEIVVTGSFIKGQTQFNSPSPISVIGANDLSKMGASNIADLVQSLTINNGAQNNPDAFTQNATTGTSNFNLRGLGVASTLVLLNGKRQVSAGTVTNDGVAFVDTSSLTPQIAIQRVEILKDGAAAIYGTDAVAGVVNFITDDKFEGVAINAKDQFVTDQGSQRDLLIEAKFGWGNDTTNFMIAGSYYDRTPLTTEERRLSRIQDDSSVLGNPGAFFLTGGGGLPAGVPFVDPTGCESEGGILTRLGGDVPIGPLSITPGFCGFDFGNFFNLVPEEERKQGIAVLNQRMGETANLRLEASYAKNEASRGNSPTFPFLQLGSAVVPATHPEFPLAFQLTGEPAAVFFGRASGNGGKVSPNAFESETWRVNATLDGEFANGWSWEVSATRASNDYIVSTQDTVTANFQAALFGFGGNGCDAAAGVPGANGCEYFNPFSTSFTTAPNSQGILDFVTGTQVITGKSRLTVLDAVFSGTVGETASGDIGVAVGFQYRDETWGRDYDDCSNADCFAFIIGDQDFEATQDVKAAFIETRIPLTERLDLSAALRYEDYGGNIGSTIDPKISLMFRPNDTVVLRGSFSTSFRAPSVFQTKGNGTSLQQVADPRNGGAAFAAVRGLPTPAGGRDLSPEQSEAFNFGISWEPSDGVAISVDFWNYNFSDAIIVENSQAVVDAFSEDSSRVIRSPAGSILMVLVDRVNASSVKTNGVDFGLKYDMETSAGTITPAIDATRVFSYDIDDPQAGKISGAGKRNFANFGTPTPKLRGNASLTWSGETMQLAGFVRYIGGMDDDQNPGTRIGSMTTVDLQYRLNMSAFYDGGEGISLTVGLINAFDKAPPQVFTNGGFESRTHDPRGRMAYVNLSASF